MSYELKKERRQYKETGHSLEAELSSEVLIRLRQIIRATDLHSKRVYKRSGLTVPQIVILQAIHERGEVTTGEISKQVNLSQATVTTILDRLEKRNLVERYRSSVDRRVVHTKLTSEGHSTLKNAPALLHEQFVREFSDLEPSYQELIVEILGKVAQLLNAEHIDAAPLLDTQPPQSDHANNG